MLLGRTATFVRFLVYFQEGKVKGASSSGVIGMQGGNLKLSQQQVLNLRGNKETKPIHLAWASSYTTIQGQEIKKRCVYSFFTSAGPHCTLPFNTSENETYLETTVSVPPPRLLAPLLQRILFKSAAIELSKVLTHHPRAHTLTHTHRKCRVINSPCRLARKGGGRGQIL